MKEDEMKRIERILKQLAEEYLQNKEEIIQKMEEIAWQKIRKNGWNSADDSCLGSVTNYAREMEIQNLNKEIDILKEKKEEAYRKYLQAVEAYERKLAELRQTR